MTAGTEDRWPTMRRARAETRSALLNRLLVAATVSVVGAGVGIWVGLATVDQSWPVAIGAGIVGAVSVWVVAWVVVFAWRFVHIRRHALETAHAATAAALMEAERLKRSPVRPDHEKYLKDTARHVAQAVSQRDHADFGEDDTSRRREESLRAHFPDSVQLIERWNQAVRDEATARQRLRGKIGAAVLKMNTPPSTMPFAFDGLCSVITTTLSWLEAEHRLDEPYFIVWKEHESPGRLVWVAPKTWA